MNDLRGNVSQGYLIGCALPYANFGRLSVPTKRLRYRDGWIRFTESRDKQRLLAYLVDEQNQLIYADNQIEACLKSERLGLAVQLFLGKFNKYQAGEAVGDREQVLVGV